jgi:putative sporulation protein YtxC
MPSFRVDYVKDIKGLAGYLEKRFETNARSPFRIRISQDNHSLTILMDGCIRKNGRKYLTAINHLSDTLAEYILKSYEKNILEKVINRVCEGLTKQDKDEIYRIACTRLYTQQGEESPGCHLETRRRIISANIAECLRNSENLILEGFLTFRLGEYVKRLEIEVERSIRQFFVERQYEEYINLLTAFVRMQVPRVPELHIFALRNGTYKVEGIGPFEIPEDISDGFGFKGGEPIIDSDDFMIGFLLTCAPVRIFIHNASLFRNKELLNTIRIVFSECVLLND